MADVRPTTLTLPVAPERDHIQGRPDAAVVLLEYGDYECPYCGRAYPIVRQLQSALGERLCVAFRNFPLNNVHPHASAAAQAAEAAAAQGKFWEMHALLFEHQGDLEPHDLDRYALRLGLEIYKFQSDVSGQRYAKRVRDDYESGQASGVRGTPTFFI
ncbi:MAG TPA: thioredoxin domain-containing protein, partial [Tepidisphaeraceae bacterium]|nr:thioredoxin domain-containing protein [Tepidisphaeraceae bacterium]